MHLILAAVGRLKKGPECELVERYVERIKASGRNLGFARFSTLEIAESRAASAEARQREEEKSLLDKLPAESRLVLFDERGKSRSSRQFSREIAAFRDQGDAHLAFVIGGPDGLSPEFRKQAATIVSFGQLTLPHQLARVMVAEQIYRAMTILSGHPYHRD